MKKLPIFICCIIALVAFAIWVANGHAYEQYHPSDATATPDGCYQCHGFAGSTNPTVGTPFEDPSRFQNGGFDGRGPLHDLHVSQITGNCALCHIQTGDVPFTYRSGQVVDADHPQGGQGCRGCHGADPGPSPADPFDWGAGLRLHHTNVGAPPDLGGLFCADCHGNDPAPPGEDTTPVYYTYPDVNAKDSCNADGSEDWGTSSPFDPITPDGFGLDNDGDLIYDGADPDCEAPSETNCFDGIDNDADGLIDCEDPDCEGAIDGPCDTGQPGICADGTFECRNLALVCVPNNVPQPEGPYLDPTCMDGLDNDCDGLIDMDDPDCMPPPPETNCFDGIDNDNDDLIDCQDPDCEGAVDGPCDTGLPGICADGTLTCQAGMAMCIQNNQPVPELCNDLDDDCDGSIDEDFPNKGMPCTVGIGACERTGTYICTADGSGTICDAVPGQPQPEGPPGDPTCMDGVDNDCDGLTDMVDPDCQQDIETNCFDGIDNDNDDLIDCMDPDCEGAVDGPCDTGLPGICADGTLTCRAGMAMCIQNNQPMPEGNQYTNCEDGLDNDCDGLTDYDDPDCVMMEADVWLEKLRVPKSLHLATGGSRDKKIVALGEGDTKAQDSTVVLTVSPINAVTVALSPASITQLVTPGNGRTQFRFVATITCNMTGEWALMWSATISAPENRDPTNDTMMGTTNVVCR